jgi:hypothetical protein
VEGPRGGQDEGADVLLFFFSSLPLAEFFTQQLCSQYEKKKNFFFFVSQRAGQVYWRSYTHSTWLQLVPTTGA